MTDNKKEEFEISTVEIKNLLPHHEEWLDGCGVKWPNGTKFSELDLSSSCKVIAFSRVFGKWSIYPTYVGGPTPISADDFCKAVGSKIGVEFTQKKYSAGWYLALVRECVQSESEVPKLLYYGTYEYEAPEVGTEEEIKGISNPAEFRNGTTIIGVGFHEEIQQLFGEYDTHVRVYHFEKYPKIIKLEKLKREFEPRKIK